MYYIFHELSVCNLVSSSRKRKSTALFLILFSLSFAFLGNIAAFSQQKNSSPGWYDKLPDCPCFSPGDKLDDGWAIEKGDLSKFHKGATTSFRSYPAIETSAGKSGQQCCYDENGKLITSGQAAGTPDRIGTCKGENEKGIVRLRILGLPGHFKNDVKPWKQFMQEDSIGWKKYNSIWVPNTGKSCTANAK
jgi:hypothetical protein